jgi:hypothetical protein
VSGKGGFGGGFNNVTVGYQNYSMTSLSLITGQTCGRIESSRVQLTWNFMFSHCQVKDLYISLNSSVIRHHAGFSLGAINIDERE